MSEPSVDAILTEEGPDALQQMTETCHDCGNHDKCQAQRAAEAEVERLRGDVQRFSSNAGSWRDCAHQREQDLSRANEEIARLRAMLGDDRE